MNIGQLGPYRIEEELGHGGMATVYRAFHLPLRRFVALKVLNSLLSRDTDFQQRFEQEATVAARLEHPNIVSIYDLGMADDHQYIAMRLIEGPTLEQVVRQGGPMATPRALTIVAELADALAYAHNEGVVHRDVKPSNVILRSDDRPILTDFGIARAVEGLRLTMSQSVVGTPRYMSPEQAQGRTADHRSDIYSLGVLLYEMLAGQPPFTATSTPALLYMHVHEAPPPLGQVRPDLPAGVRDLVGRCLAKSPDDRFQTASEVAAACRAMRVSPDLHTSGETVVWPVPTPPLPAAHSDAPPGSRQSGSLAPLPSAAGLPPSPVPPPQLGPARPAAEPPTMMGVPAEYPLAPATPAPAAPPAPEHRRFSIPVPLAVGLAAIVILIAGLLAWTGDRFPARSSTRPTAAPATSAPPPVVAAAPTSAPAAAASQPKPAAPAASAPSPAPAAAASPAAAPDSASRRLSDAMGALGRRDYAAALEQANAGLGIDSKDAGLAKAAVQARLGYGDQLWSQGNLQQALVQFLAVREQPLRSATSPAELRQAELSAPYLWGELTWKVDQVAALYEYQKTYRLDPGFKDVRDKVYTGDIALAGQLAAQGDREGAMRYLNAARAVDPNRPEADALLRTLTPTPSR